MPYTENHALLRWGGSAWQGQESWSCSTRLRQPGGDSPEALLTNAQDTVEAIAAIVETYVETNAAMFNGQSLLEYVELNPISAATGDYLFPNSPVRFELVTPAAPPLPAGYPQVAYCVTLRSSLYRRGPAARGRWYVPAGSAGGAVTSTGVMPATLAEEAADAAGTFLQSVSNLGGVTDPDPWVAWLYGDGIGGPRDSPVGTVQVGNVWDTQRRRRRQIVETYSDATTWNGGVG